MGEATAIIRLLGMYWGCGVSLVNDTLGILESLINDFVILRKDGNYHRVHTSSSSENDNFVMHVINAQ